MKLLPGQKAPPCDSQAFEEAINAGCWIGITAKPPCGRYFRQGDKCYAPVAEPKKPAPDERPVNGPPGPPTGEP